MEYHKVDPKLSKTLNILMTKLLFPIKEYNKDGLTDSSYIFTPNHTNNLDGYIIWCLLSRYFDIDTFMYREFWENYPNIAKLLPIINVYPITRDKVVLSEIKEELKKLRDENHSLVIFPQGRHVDPEIMLNLPEYHLETIPSGAFYFSAESNKKFVPIYMEPQKMFRKSVVMYGNPIDPNNYDIRKPNGKLDFNALHHLRRLWLEELNRIYLEAQKLENRPMHPYRLERGYLDATGSNIEIQDPNLIADYIDDIKRIISLREETGIEDIYELCGILNIPEEERDIILECSKTYNEKLLKKL